MVEAANDCVAHWKSRGSKPFVTNVEEDMTEATFAIIARTILAGVSKADGEIIKRAGRAYLDRSHGRLQPRSSSSGNDVAPRQRAHA